MTLWPFPPNWKTPYTLSFEFRTDIFTSRSGKEQRRAGRQTPRRTIKFSVLRGDDDFRKLNALMRSAQRAPLALPVLAWHRRVVAGAMTGSSTITLDSLADWTLDGTTMILADRTGYAEVVCHLAGGNVLTLTSPLTRDWIEPKLHPRATGWLDPTLSDQVFGRRVMNVPVTISVDPGSFAPEFPGDPEEVFNGREVMLFSPNYSGAIPGGFHIARESVDFGYGRIATYLPVQFITRTKQFQILGGTQAERQRIVAFFLRMVGQQREFYMPAMADDLPIVGGTSTTAVIAGTLANDVYHADATNRAVIVERDGAHYFRRITGTTGDGMNSTLTTDTAWPWALDASSTMRWLNVCRFAVDQFDLECLTDEVTRAQISVLTLEDLAVSLIDDALPGLDGAAALGLSTWGYAGFGVLGDTFERIVDTYTTATESFG